MEEPEHIEELARRLFAAAISCWTGVSLQHAYNNSLKSQENEIGPYWIELAKQVTAPIGSANPHLPIESTFADRVELFDSGARRISRAALTCARSGQNSRARLSYHNFRTV